MSAIFSPLCALEGTSTMLRKAMSVLALTIALTAGSALADTLIVEGISATDNANQRPERGLTKASVEASWGAPRQKSAAVGDPPISSWDYEPFVVFFEYDRVLHTVVKR
ncbi:MAG: hypothetical protein QGF91_05725 [Gammaproteobacteria bacterium]|nr:hypothetical protein [Gammaproteobacteria bacterium]